MNQDFKNYLLKVTNASDYKEIEIIQALWSNYGKISRYQLEGASMDTIVVKYISLNQAKDHPRGWKSNFSHDRKVRSYEVETNWYKSWSRYCTDLSKVPNYIGSFSDQGDQWIILEDLNTQFPLRKYELDYTEIKSCLKWLAIFHVTFLNKEPVGLWDVGTYWNLDTRPDEWEVLEHQELKAKAHQIDALLNQCKFKTFVHGDAKLANFCFSENGKQVAAVDFQYVGGGCGIKDVAYFLGSCLSSSESSLLEEELLNFYFSEMRKSLESTNSSINFGELESEWRKMYPIACTDFNRFLLGWMPTHQKINNYNLNMMNTVLASLKNR